MVGNALCLDFSNTVNVRYSPPTRDWLASRAEAAEWARAAGVRVVRSRVRADLLPEARAVRDVVYRTFSAVTRGDRPAQQDLDALAAAHAGAMTRRRLGPAGDTYGLVADPGPDPLRAVLDDVAISAVDLLTRGALDRLGECPSCGWLFLDTSKNGRRRWCSMATCGSRDKARRYYASRA